MVTNGIAMRSRRLLVGVSLVAVTCVAGLVPAQASARDGDGDGMPNRWEKAHGLNPGRPNARGNPDADGLRNLAEFRNGTDPLVADSDDDGLTDGDEVKDFETDPTDPDTDGDGIVDGDDDSDEDGVADDQEDGEEDGDTAGTVASFDATTGILTVDTTLGTQVTGTVTAETELEWDDCDDVPVTTADLVAGTDVDELEFVDGTTDLESVELVPAAACSDDDGED